MFHDALSRTLLDERALAAYLGLTRRAVQAWRLRGGGPKFIKVGRSVRYRPADIEDWLSAREFENTSEATAR